MLHMSLPIRPILRLPATTKGSLFSNVFNIDHIDHFLLVETNLVVDTFALASSSRTLSNGTEGKISNINESSS